MDKLFVYGTLNDPDFLTSILGRKFKVSSDRLSGYCQDFIFIDDQSFPNIYKCANGFVRGSVISGLSDIDLIKLDVYEGDRYRRISVLLDSKIRSYVYISD